MTHYQTNHSYILELKYLSKSDYTEKNAQEQWDEAVEQIKNKNVDWMAAGLLANK